MPEKFPESIDSLTRDMIENTVIDWMNKCALGDGNLAGFYSHDQVKDHAHYEELKPHLPAEVFLYDGL